MFNFDVPTHAEDYVHRIDVPGVPVAPARPTLATRNDAKYVDAIEQLIERTINREAFGPADAADNDKPRKSNRRNNNSGERKGRGDNEGKSEQSAKSGGGKRRGLLGRNRAVANLTAIVGRKKQNQKSRNSQNSLSRRINRAARKAAMLLKAICPTF